MCFCWQPHNKVTDVIGVVHTSSDKSGGAEFDFNADFLSDFQCHFVPLLSVTGKMPCPISQMTLQRWKKNLYRVEVSLKQYGTFVNLVIRTKSLRVEQVKCSMVQEWMAHYGSDFMENAQQHLTFV